jgi:hypothetical protein
MLRFAKEVQNEAIQICGDDLVFCVRGPHRFQT